MVQPLTLAQGRDARKAEASAGLSYGHMWCVTSWDQARSRLGWFS